MRLLFLVPLTAAFSTLPLPYVPSIKSYEPPDGLVLIRDRYQFEGAEHPMTGLTPDGPGPHKLIVVVTGYDPANYPTEFGAHDDHFTSRVRGFELGAMQGHGMVVVETPGFNF